MTFGNVFNIQRFSVHDGPGIRSTIFFKGCPLSCAWCHNPESISFEKTHVHNTNKCTACGDCTSACPEKAGELSSDKALKVFDRCVGCGLCEETCLFEARELVGKKRSVEELVELVERDRMFYEESGGGVTLSGGEVLSQGKFALDLSRALKSKGIHVTLDTSGFGKQDELLQLAEVVDMILFDVKMMDTVMHMTHTGVGNIQILNNLKALDATGVEVQIRIPLIEGLSGTQSNIDGVIGFLSKTRFRSVALLPFHNIGRAKYDRLGIEETISRYEAPNAERINEIKNQFITNGYTVQIGG